MTNDYDGHGPLVGPNATEFRVWAPRAEQVELELRGRRQPMRRHEHGWWLHEAPAAPGDRYGFRLEGGPLRPDPAARRLPDGVHGAAELVDTTELGWSREERSWRPPPLSSAAIYELHVGTFTPAGTLDAAAEKLPSLAELGVTHVEVMPVNAFNGTAGWGYDGVAWYAVHEPYGGPYALARFVDAAHRAGLAVILDVVYNHLGPSGNYLPEFGPYLTDRYRTPWGDGLNLDGPDSDPVRAFIVGNALHWLRDFHVDALRLDAVHGLVDTSAVPILVELSQAVDRLSVLLGRRLELIAESDRSDPKTIAPRPLGGDGLDAQWADDLHHAVHVAVTGERDGYYLDYAGLPDVAAAYRHGFVYGGRYSPYRRRTVGAPLPDDVPGWRLVACVQNHDQVGNRALGERLLSLVGPELTRVAAVLLAAAPATPMLFMGEEHGERAPFQYFTSHPEPELAEAVRRGRREEFSAFSAFGDEVPDPQDPDTVRRSRVDWARAETPEGKAWRELWSELLRVRRREPALANGRRDLVQTLQADDDVLVLVRGDDSGSRVLVAANVGDRSRPVRVPAADGWQLLLDVGERPARDGEALVLPPRGASLWSATVPLLP